MIVLSSPAVASATGGDGGNPAPAIQLQLSSLNTANAQDPTLTISEIDAA